MKTLWFGLMLCLLALPARAVPLKIVHVGAPAINCVFDPTCIIHGPTDSTSSIPLAGAAGTAFLQTRTYKATANSPAAGRTMYQYRIDLRQAYGIVAVPCIKSMSLSFPNPATLDYNGNTVADEQVFVITTGGLGSTGPTTADRTSGQITFTFASPVCAGAGPGTGKSSYFFGLTASTMPTSVTAKLSDTLGPQYSVGARAPLVFIPLPGPVIQGSGYIPPECGTDPVSSPNVMDCWLQHYPDVAGAINWQRSDGSKLIDAWPNWTVSQKTQLRKAFLDAWTWYQGGMTSFQGTPVPEPPTNQEVLADNGWSLTVLDGPTEAWPLYLAQVAHSLAAEMGGWVPWTLRTYDATELSELLGGYPHYYYDSDVQGDVYNSVYPGYVIFGSMVTPAHSTVTFEFLKTNGLLAGTRKATIVKLLEWSRDNLSHFLGSYAPLNQEYHWQYRGLAPVSRVLEGTLLTDPQYAPAFPTPRHWTAGCYGTTDFLRDLLRAANIPVQKKSSGVTCGHTMPYFITEGLYLSHGDDPYNSLDKETPFLPMDEVLIDQVRWDQWFTNAADPCDNVGRRVTELRVQYLSEELADKYCSDLALNLDHASGQVYQELQYHYTVAELEAATLWSRLATLAQQLGKCGP